MLFCVCSLQLCSLPVFRKMVTLPLNPVSSSLAGIRADPHDHQHPSCSWRGTGQSISGLTVGLQGALHLHQSTQQIGPLQSTRLGSPHVSPLHVNSKGVRLSSTGSPCYVALRNMGSLFRVKMLDHSLRDWSCLCKQVIFKNIRLDLETIRTSAS